MKRKIHVKEPEFMKNLHKIRAELAAEWKKMTPGEMIRSINESGRWLKKQTASRFEKV